jgi:hypothetical protein
MVTTLYAGILGLMYIGLAIFTIHGRYKYRVNLGTGNNENMEKRVRVHGNFAEYVPFALLIMLFAEVEGISENIIHALGIALVMGRVLHPFGILFKFGPSVGRTGGMFLTFGVIIVGSFLCIKSYFIIL